MSINNDKRIQERNQQKLGFRLLEGIKSVFLPPFSGLIPVSILTVLLFVGLSNRTLIFNTSMSWMRYKFVDYIKIAALVSVFLVFLLALLVRLAKPYKCRIAEGAALTTFTPQSPSECPILISSKIVTFGRRRWEFFSMWVTLEEWQDKDKYSKILSALDCHLVGQIKHGGRKHNNSHRIVFCTRPGAGPIDRGVLIDEEI